MLKFNTFTHSDLKVSEVCLGTMIFGTQLDEKASLEIIDIAVKEYGINFLDSAELYPVPMSKNTHGKTDQIIALWLKHNPSYKHKLIISNKVIAYAPHLNWIRNGPKPTHNHFIQSLEHTLTRLQIDCLDLFFIHWPARNTPMFGSTIFDPNKERTELEDNGTNFVEQIGAINDLIKQGKVKSWGLSNENSWGLMKILSVCKNNNFALPCALQNPYSLLNRTLDSEISELCFRENIGVLSYSPLAFGHLTGKYLNSSDQNQYQHHTSTKHPDTRLKYKNFGSRYESPRVYSAVKLYHQLAKDSQLTLTQLALKFNQSRSFMTSTIIGASKPSQLHSNIQAFLDQTELSPSLMKKIDQIHHSNPNPSP